MLESLGASLLLGGAVSTSDESESPLTLGAEGIDIATTLLDGGDILGDLASPGAHIAWSQLTLGDQIGLVGSGSGDRGVDRRDDRRSQRPRRLDVALSALDLGADISTTLWQSAGGQLLARAGLVVGLAFSAWDTARAIDEGDWIGAAAAAAPIVGAAIGAVVAGATIGAGLTSWLGPGAIVGAAIGALVGIGIQLVRGIWQDDPMEKYEQGTQEALEAAFAAMGFDEDEADRLAHRLRDVDDDFVGVGPVIAQVADEMGIPADLLLVSAIDARRRRAGDRREVMLGVDTNSGDVRDDDSGHTELVVDEGDATALADALEEMGFGEANDPDVDIVFGRYSDDLVRHGTTALVPARD